ncbi:MAG: PPC domain-containing protein [Chloroflexi bacterium]|nr:PPC domain-containing protein [Chloroflexota bacterium]
MKVPQITKRTGRIGPLLLALLLLLPVLVLAGSVAYADDPTPPPTKVPGDVKIPPDLNALEQGLQSKELPQQKAQKPNGKEPDQFYTCRDSFEIDDAPWYYPSQLRLIALGDIQQHNFCPSYDRDVARVNLTAGNTYRVRTFELGSWADTFVGIYTPNLQRIAYDDDSGSAHGDGRYASYVTFQAPYTGSYYIVVWNLFNSGYGPYTNYKLTVNQVEGGGGGGTLAPTIRVDRGCGASYRLGAYIGIYFTTYSSGPVQIQKTTSAGTSTLYSNGYLPAGYYLLQGYVGNPLGTHTYTISNTQGSATCGITVTSTGYSAPQQQQPDAPQGGATVLPLEQDVQP